MWQRTSLGKRWALLVAVVALLLAAINVWWFLTYRDGYPLDIDEAGYTAFGLADYLGLQNGGLHGWWNSIQAQGTFAPLAPALTSLTVYVHPGALNGFLVLSGFLFVLAMAAYGIGERLVGPRLGALSALVTATLPGAFAFSREYIYALPAAALLSCAVYAALKSDGLRSRRWAIACGAAIGLMLLARTMTVGFAPGVIAAAVLAGFLRADGDLPRRFVNLCLLLVSGAAVAATWYARNLQSVIDYLTGYGYGNQSKFYGPEHAPVSWARMRGVAERITVENLYLPLAILTLAALITIAVVVIKRLIPADTRRSVLKQLAASDAFSIALVFAAGYAALMSSQNVGDGFTLPLAVLLPALAVLALRRFPGATVPAVAILAVIAIVNLISTATIWPAASRARMVSIPGLHEEMPITNGVPIAVARTREQFPGPETTFDDRDREWVQADNRVAELLADFTGPNGEAPVMTFGSRSRILNTNTVQLASLLKYQRAYPLTQLLAEPNDTVRNYLRQLGDPKFGMPTVLFTMSRNTDDYTPLVTQEKAELAARKLGFRRQNREVVLPDGRQLRVWVKETPETSH